MNSIEAEDYLVDRYGEAWKDHILFKLDVEFSKTIAEDLWKIEYELNKLKEGIEDLEDHFGKDIVRIIMGMRE